MALTIPAILDKLLDNANLGKVVTDVGAGLALSVSFVMLLGMWTGISVLPADEYTRLEQDARDTAARRDQERDRLREPLAAAAALPGGLPLPADADGPYLHSLARRQIANLSAQLEGLDRQMDAVLKGTLRGGPSLDQLTRSRRELASLNDQLVAQVERVGELDDRLQTLENRMADARSLVRNLETFTDNLSAVLAFSVIFGVLLSQVQRLVFVHWIYDPLLKRSATAGGVMQAIRSGRVEKKDYEELITNYYRYVEGSVNMILPVLLFGLVFPAYVKARLPVVSAPSALWFGAGAVVLAALLAVSGFYTYRRFRAKEDELVRAGS